MPFVAYARTSTAEQKGSIKTQIDRFRELGVDDDLIFVEQRSAKSAADRPQLQELLRTLRRGDTLVVTKIDRLARSTTDLFAILGKVKAKGARFKALDQPEIDTTTAHGELVLSILGAVAAFERSLIEERRLEGIRKAMERGVKFGPPTKLGPELVAAIKVDRLNNLSIREIVKSRGLSRASVYRALQLGMSK